MQQYNPRSLIKYSSTNLGPYFNAAEQISVPNSIQQYKSRSLIQYSSTNLGA